MATDEWSLLLAPEETHPHTPALSNLANKIVPLAQLQGLTEKDFTDNQIGVLLKNDTDLGQLDESLFAVPLIAIEFPGFVDGRGFSLARTLRDYYQYKGIIRAVGYILPDQLFYLTRCGFNEFLLDDDIDQETVNQCLSALSETYQAAADDPQPLFRRRN